jgi:hypothetical protein
VDDLLLILSNMIKPPVSPKTSSVPSWLPAQITTQLANIGRAASSVLQSPSSNRSSSSAGSRRQRARSGSAQNSSVRSGASSAVGFGAGAGGAGGAGGNGNNSSSHGSNHSGSAQNSYRSFRVAGSVNGIRRTSRGGDPTTPSSARSTVSRHVQVDADAVLELSVGEPTGENSHRSSPRTNP